MSSVGARESSDSVYSELGSYDQCVAGGEKRAEESQDGLLENLKKLIVELQQNNLLLTTKIQTSDNSISSLREENIQLRESVRILELEKETNALRKTEKAASKVLRWNTFKECLEENVREVHGYREKFKVRRDKAIVLLRNINFGYINEHLICYVPSRPEYCLNHLLDAARMLRDSGRQMNQIANAIDRIQALTKNGKEYQLDVLQVQLDRELAKINEIKLNDDKIRDLLKKPIDHQYNSDHIRRLFLEILDNYSCLH